MVGHTEDDQLISTRDFRRKPIFMLSAMGHPVPPEVQHRSSKEFSLARRDHREYP
jgi:hypothetical protein